MNKQDLRKFLDDHGFTQSFLGLMLGRDARQIRYWLAGDHAIPIPVQIVLMAYDDGKLESKWLAKTLSKINPKAAKAMGIL